MQKLFKLYDEAASKIQPSGVGLPDGRPVGGPPLTFDSWYKDNRNSKNVRLILLTNGLGASDFVEGEKAAQPPKLPPNQKFIKK